MIADKLISCIGLSPLHVCSSKEWGGTGPLEVGQFVILTQNGYNKLDRRKPILSESFLLVFGICSGHEVCPLYLFVLHDWTFPIGLLYPCNALPAGFPGSEGSGRGRGEVISVFNTA